MVTLLNRSSLVEVTALYNSYIQMDYNLASKEAIILQIISTTPKKDKIVKEYESQLVLVRKEIMAVSQRLEMLKNILLTIEI